jgi:hypothetical protein
MNPDSENFEPLRRLLALKRHEQPPPRYFSTFSTQVIDRIRAEEGARRRPVTEGTWWERLWTVLEAKPLFAGAFGAGVCAVLVSGILSSGEMMPTGVTGTAVVPTGNAIGAAALQPEPFRRSENLTSLPMDTNALALKAMFDSFELQATPVSATLALPNN